MGGHGRVRAGTDMGGYGLSTAARPSVLRRRSFSAQVFHASCSARAVVRYSIFCVQFAYRYLNSL